MDKLLSLYIACTIFGVGVTIIDMLGVLGDFFHEGEDGADGGDDAGDGDDGGDGHDGGNFGDDGGDFGDDGGDSGDDGGDFGDDGGDSGDDGSEGDEGENGEEAEDGGEQGEKGSLVSHEHYRQRHFSLRVLSIARSLVHFSFGFGPVGWFALATGRSTASSLAWSVPIGVVALAGGRVLRRIQRSELDSQFTAEDMIMERGEVLVSIGKGQMGKVRILMEGTYTERFARAKNPEESFRTGSSIRVVDVSDECVYVEED